MGNPGSRIPRSGTGGLADQPDCSIRPGKVGFERSGSLRTLADDVFGVQDPENPVCDFMEGGP